MMTLWIFTTHLILTYKVDRNIMQSLRYKLFELIILFIILPISFIISYPTWMKFIIGGSSFAYIIWVLLKIENYKINISLSIKWEAFWKRVLFPLMIIITVTTYYVWITDQNQLFYVLLNNFKLWLFILFFYSIFSVYPQEVIYRAFFFKRYQVLFKNKYLFILVNAALFSLAHVFFMNILVIIFTFIGGVLFALTYQKTKSTLLVSIEHSIYGCWLFTIGMGDMLGFPS